MNTPPEHQRFQRFEENQTSKSTPKKKRYPPSYTDCICMLIMIVIIFTAIKNTNGFNLFGMEGMISDIATVITTALLMLLTLAPILDSIYTDRKNEPSLVSVFFTAIISPLIYLVMTVVGYFFHPIISLGVAVVTLFAGIIWTIVSLIFSPFFS